MIPIRITTTARGSTILLLLALSLVGWPAQGVAAQSPAPVLRSILFEGLDRTKEVTVRRMVPLSPGDVLTEEALEDATNELIDSGLFADVQATVYPLPEDPATADVLFTLDERWTLIPLPFFYTDGEDAAGGVILMESNLLGRNKLLATAGFFGTDGFSGFVTVADPSIAGSSYSASVSGATSVSDVTAELPNGDEIRSYSRADLRASLGLGYRLSRDFALRGGVGVGSVDVEEFDGVLDSTEPGDVVYVEPSADLIFDATTPLYVLRQGPSATLSGRRHSDPVGWELAGDAGYAIGIAGYQRLRLRVSGGYGEMPIVGEAEIGGSDGYRTLPLGGAFADRWGSVSAFYDLPFLRREWGALVATHFWEGGAFDTEVIDRQVFYGTGVGISLYLIQVAIPALGFNVAYNVESDAFFGSFSLGRQF